MPRTTHGNGGRLGGLLLMAAGLFTIVNNYLPGAGLLDVALLNTVGLVALVTGALAYAAPWPRWHPRAPLALAVVAFGLIAVSNRYGGVSAYSYAVYFVVIFVWVGIAQPPGTSLLLAVPAAVTYVLPLLLADTRPPNAVSSVSVAIPVCVLVGETIARTVRRQGQAQRALADRALLLERLAALAGDVTADLDLDTVLARTCSAARELVAADAAAFVTSDGTTARVAAVEGLPGHLVGAQWPAEGSSIGVVLATRSPLVVTDFTLYPDRMDELCAAVPGLHTMLAIPSIGRGEVRGALYVLLAQPGRRLATDETGVTLLLAGHAGAALANAAAYAEVVRAHAHEEAVVGAMADGMAVVAADGTVIGWNPAAAALTGLPVADVVGRPLPFPTGPSRVTTDHHLPDGRWIEVVASPIDEAGETVVSFRDVSTAKMLDEAKDMFLATTSHELRTPITVIKGYVAILRRNWERLSDTERMDALAAVADRTDALVGLVDHLLLGTRAGAARFTLEAAPFDLGPAVAAAADGFGNVSEGHRVTVAVPAAVPYVLGDRAAVEPVVGQLLDNAIKYSPGGGDVLVSVRAGDGYATVEVLDRGVGLPEEERARLFTRFWQGGAGDRREFPGLGLGLHIVRSLVEAQGGTVFAENRPGGGARVGFTLPYAPVVPGSRTSADDRTLAT